MARELTLEGCRAEYGGRVVFDRVDLAVESGDLLAVVGASGVGKSTLLLLLAGLKAPAAGTLRHRGRLVTGPQPDVGIVFQDHTLFPWMTVEENVEVGLRLRGVDAKTRRSHSRRQLQEFGIEECRRAYPDEVSGGQRQRVALARTLVLEPSVVLLDEPFSALDALTRERLQEITRTRLAAGGLTGLIVTHDTEEAVFLGTRLGVLAAPSDGAPARLTTIPNPAHGRERSDPVFVDTRARLRRMLTEVSNA